MLLTIYRASILKADLLRIGNQINSKMSVSEYNTYEYGQTFYKRKQAASSIISRNVNIHVAESEYNAFN